MTGSEGPLVALTALDTERRKGMHLASIHQSIRGVFGRVNVKGAL
jgi:hypothetical protein